MNPTRLRSLVSRVSTVDVALTVTSVVAVVWIELPLLAGVFGVATEAASQQGRFHLVGPVLNASLMLFALYAFLPLVYPQWMREPVRRSRAFRGALAVYAFPIALDMYWVAPATPSVPDGLDPLGSGPNLFVYLSVGVVVVLLGYARASDLPVIDPEGHAMAPLLRLGGDDPDDLTRLWHDVAGHPLGSTKALWLFLATAAGALYATPVLFLGLAVGTFNLYYPVLEVLAVAKVLVTSTTARVDGADGQWSWLQLPDVESVVYRHIKVALTTRGRAALIVALFGMITSIVYFVIPGGTPGIDLPQWRALGAAAGQFLRLRSTDAMGYVLERTVTALAYFGVENTLALCSGYGLWYWYHVLRRTPALVAARAENPVSRDVVPEATLPARPPGALVPAAAMVYLWYLWPHTYAGPEHWFEPLVGALWFATVWVGLAAVLLWTVVATSRRSGTQPTSPVRELFAPFVVQVSVTVWVTTVSTELLTGVLALVALVLVQFYTPALQHRFRDDIGLAGVGVVIAVAFTGAVALAFPTSVALGSGLLVAVVYLGGAWMAGIERG